MLRPPFCGKPFQISFFWLRFENKYSIYRRIFLQLLELIVELIEKNWVQGINIFTFFWLWHKYLKEKHILPDIDDVISWKEWSLVNQAHRSDKNPYQSQDTLRAKYTIGNSCLYQYKDAEGRTVQISRPAFIKIREQE